MVSKSLLIGNGINRLSGNDSWLSVLKYLAGPTKQEEILRFRKYKPFTLIFEELVLQSDRFRDPSEYELKEKVANRIDAIKPNKYHQLIANCGIENIITTNYDYTFEKGAINYERSSVMPESKYSLFRRVKMSDCSIWHIHGELEAPNTIMLGHEHYIGYVQKIRNYFTSGIQSKKVNHPIKSPLNTKGEPRFDFDSQPANPDNIYSWVDILLRDEIHIIGFKFDYTEQHLWSLLTRKEHLRRAYPNKVGKAYFHFFKQNGLSEEEEAKASIFESLGAEVKVTKWTQERHEAYDKFYKQYL